jgi:hypothetical protein
MDGRCWPPPPRHARPHPIRPGPLRISQPLPPPPLPSAPINYVVGTQLWADTGDRYHRVASDAADAAAPGCAAAVRRGLEEIRRLGATRAGRRRLGERLGLCNASDAVQTREGAFVLSEVFYWAFPGYAQVRAAGVGQ